MAAAVAEESAGRGRDAGQLEADRRSLTAATDVDRGRLGTVSTRCSHRPILAPAKAVDPRYIRAMLSKRAWWPMKASVVWPVGPFRCLATMISAVPWVSVESGL